MIYFAKVNLFRFIPIYLIRNYSKSHNNNLFSLLKSMPKEKKHIAEAQKQRNKIKEKSSRYVPGKVTLQVLGTGAVGAPRSVYLFSDQSRYLFNCGEGTQRLAHEHKMKLAKLEHIFITQPVWKNIGGLPGTALTIQDVGVPEITLHGPQGLDELFIATRRFVILRDLNVKMAECDEGNMFEDNVMKVLYVPITPNPTIKEEECKSDNDVINDGIESENAKTIQVGTSETSEASTSTKSDKVNRRRRSRSKTPPVAKMSSEDDEEDNIDYYAHEHSGSRVQPQTVSAISKTLLKETKEKGISMTYICQLQPRPGALNLDKCVKLGVPPGPLLGKLKNGEDVTLPNGLTVKSKEVCDPDDPGPVFIVVDCPSEEYIDSLVNNHIFKKHQADTTSPEDVCDLIVHFSPPTVMQHPRYKQWIEDFTLSTQHLVINESNTCMGSAAVHRIQHKLNLLSKDIFPLLGDRGTCTSMEDDMTLPAFKKLKSDEDNNGILPIDKLSVQSYDSPSYEDPFVHANTIVTYHLRPKKGLDRTSELTLTPKQYINECLSDENLPNLLQDLNQRMREQSLKMSIKPFPKLVFLGTGSCIPNKTRNTSGILLMTSENRHILIDSGEGTYGQLVRFFGREKSAHILSNIDAIYISHLHADHHIGLLGILQGRRSSLDLLKLDKKPVILLAPKQIMSWLNFYDNYFESVKSEFELVPNGDLIFNKQSPFSIKQKELFASLDMTNISTCLVKHCPNAFGVCFKHKDGFKITYSGDTMPTENLVSLGENSDILIHEATMEDELAHEAVIKMHSTTSQAIEVGRRMKAKNIILTHFSQRYAKLPRFNDNFSENVGIAFDNMQVRLDELPLLPLLYPAFKVMFAEHYEELEHKAVKRQMRAEKVREASVESRKQKT